MNKELVRKQPIKRGHCFVNEESEHHESVLFRSLKMMFDGWFVRKAGSASLRSWNDYHIVPATLLQKFPCSVEGTLVWIGHATFLIQVGNCSLLTDPVFGNLTFLFKRFHQPGILLEALPVLDAVLISHNHRDHMDKYTLKMLAKRNPECRFFVPLGDKKRLESWGIYNVVECSWWDRTIVVPHKASSLEGVRAEVSVTFLPARHWSGRGLFDRNRSLWGSWMIERDSYRVFFAGDTAYGDHFKMIAKEFSSCDVALLPIGPCEPRSWMRKHHMGAEEAGQAFLDLKAQVLVPMHWGTFGFGVDSPLLPLERLQIWWKTRIKKMRHGLLNVPRIGERVSLCRYLIGKRYSTLV